MGLNRTENEDSPLSVASETTKDPVDRTGNGRGNGTVITCSHSLCALRQIRSARPIFVEQHAGVSLGNLGWVQCCCEHGWTALLELGRSWSIAVVSNGAAAFQLRRLTSDGQGGILQRLRTLGGASTAEGFGEATMPYVERNLANNLRRNGRWA
uniref:(northern house mosquito) hypothetical protein n=1 Tax=Culex pipiens TaxID=7175 RepID=A0A8D8ADF0_CULPI